MILTGAEIERQVAAGRICIEPFSTDRVNPNSYNYSLQRDLVKIDARGHYEHLTIPSEGFVLEPGFLYLGATVERIGSNVYTTSLIGRSSIGRLGLFVQIDADLGQIGAVHCWTLELRATVPVRVYASMALGQVSFWETRGDVAHLHQAYAQFDSPTRSHLLK